MITVPPGARPASRVLLIDKSARLLYLHARETSTGKAFWVMPGGGLERSEDFGKAAVREVREETGLQVEPGPCIWTRHHIFEWEGRTLNQFEVFFVANVDENVIVPEKQDSYVTDHRWWSLDELRASKEQFAPGKIAVLLPNILKGAYPEKPVDCGI